VTAPAGKSYFFVAVYADSPYLMNWLEIDGKKIENKETTANRSATAGVCSRSK